MSLILHETDSIIEENPACPSGHGFTITILCRHRGGDWNVVSKTLFEGDRDDAEARADKLETDLYCDLREFEQGAL